MTNELPRRVAFPRTRAPYRGVPLPVLSQFATALRQWADTPEDASGEASAPRSATATAAVTLAEALAWAR